MILTLLCALLSLCIGARNSYILSTGLPSCHHVHVGQNWPLFPPRAWWQPWLPFSQLRRWGNIQWGKNSEIKRRRKRRARKERKQKKKERKEDGLTMLLPGSFHVWWQNANPMLHFPRRQTRRNSHPSEEEKMRLKNRKLTSLHLARTKTQSDQLQMRPSWLDQGMRGARVSLPQKDALNLPSSGPFQIAKWTDDAF